MNKKVQYFSISLSFLFYIFSAALMILMLESCGGLPLGGVAERSLSREERVGLSEIQIKVVVINSEGLTVPGLGVTAETSRSSDADITNSEGAAIVNVVVPEDDSIDFHFVSDTLDWTETLYEVPRAVESFSVVFKLDKLGRVKLGTIEY